MPHTVNLSLIDDPLRNGTYLVKVVQLTQNKQIKHHITPKNVNQCRENFLLALQNLPLLINVDVE